MDRSTPCQLDLSSLTGAQLDVFIESPMSQAELDRLAQLEAEMVAAHREQLKAELEQGKHFHRLKTHPRLLWQRDEIFKNKRGDWKKTRKWDTFVKHYSLAESGKEADRLIAQWLHHQLLAT
jgi:hypothetical protein